MYLAEDSGQGSGEAAGPQKRLEAVRLAHLILRRGREVHRLSVPVDAAVLERARVAELSPPKKKPLCSRVVFVFVFVVEIGCHREEKMKTFGGHTNEKMKSS